MSFHNVCIWNAARLHIHFQSSHHLSARQECAPCSHVQFPFMKKTTAALNKTRRKSNIMRDPFLNFCISVGAHIRTGPKRTDKISRRNRKQYKTRSSLSDITISERATTLYIDVCATLLGRPHRIAHTQLWRIILCNLGCKLSPKSGSWVRSAAAGLPAPLAVSLSLTIANIRDSLSLFIVLFRCACHSVINSASLCLRT